MKKFFSRLVAQLLSKVSGAQKSGGKGPRKADPATKARPERISLSPLHRIAFYQNDSSKDGSIQVANISASGVGLMRNSTSWEPSLQSGITGRLQIGSDEFKLEMKVEWCTPQIIGCSIQNADGLFYKALNQYFRSEMAGLNMRQMRSELLQSPANGAPYFFHGNNNCEIFYVLDGTKLESFYLSFFGNYIEGIPESPLLFGRTLDDHEFDKPNYKASELVYSSSTPTPNVLTEVIRFVENTPDISVDVKREICAQIQKFINTIPK